MDAWQVHDMAATANHDERARQRFVARFKKTVNDEMHPGNRLVYERVVLPEFVRRHHRPPKTRKELREAMEAHPYHQAWASLNRLTYEVIWDAVLDSVERQSAALSRKARARRPRLGSLTLDPSLPLPRYIANVDNHCMPGSFHTEMGNDDVFQGALYEFGDNVVAMGTRGPLGDIYGQLLADYIVRTYPALKPRAILDMGCGIGQDTLPLADAYPQAEMHAIDVGAPMLRYGHARTESMGRRVHYAQQNAERTAYPDRSFDIVCSCLLIHETSRTGLQNILGESRRLLKPGGVMVHMDGPQFTSGDLFRDFMYDWTTHYNNEPFIGTLHDLDLAPMLRKAGFGEGEFAVREIPRLGGAQTQGRLGATMGIIAGRKPA